MFAAFGNWLPEGKNVWKCEVKYYNTFRYYNRFAAASFFFSSSTMSREFYSHSIEIMSDILIVHGFGIIITSSYTRTKSKVMNKTLDFLFVSSRD